MTMISHRANLTDALNAFERYAKDSAAAWEQGAFDDHRRAERNMKAAHGRVLDCFDAEAKRLSASVQPLPVNDHAAD